VKNDYDSIKSAIVCLAISEVAPSDASAPKYAKGARHSSESTASGLFGLTKGFIRTYSDKCMSGVYQSFFNQMRDEWRMRGQIQSDIDVLMRAWSHLEKEYTIRSSLYKRLNRRHKFAYLNLAHFGHSAITELDSLDKLLSRVMHWLSLEREPLNDIDQTIKLKKMIPNYISLLASKFHTVKGSETSYILGAKKKIAFLDWKSASYEKRVHKAFGKYLNHIS
jgi:hypothetical protein